MCVCTVKRDIQESDEEAVRVKEQSILELGGLLAKTGQAAGIAALQPYSMEFYAFKAQVFFFFFLNACVFLILG